MKPSVVEFDACRGSLAHQSNFVPGKRPLRPVARRHCRFAVFADTRAEAAEGRDAGHDRPGSMLEPLEHSLASRSGDDAASCGLKLRRRIEFKGKISPLEFRSRHAGR